tara:strand:- start:746 stop:1009 length:264 start_codon:yes stop_codon:yes gene_type:complete
MTKIVYVEWQDASHSCGQWVTQGILEQEKLGSVESIGFVISENKERIILASSWDGTYASGEITIPMKMIVKRRAVEVSLPPGRRKGT